MSRVVLGAWSTPPGDQAALEKFDQVLRFNRNFFPALEAKNQVEAGTFTVALSR